MSDSDLGRLYKDGEVIVRQGDVGNCMFVIQQGQVEVIKEGGQKSVRLAVMKEGDFFGEMALFQREVRSATVQALGTTRVLTIDKKTFFRRVQRDPSLALSLLGTLSQRIRELGAELLETKALLASAAKSNEQEASTGQSNAGQ